jgi:DNA-binding LacI/PurR family transcriptional regulator
MGPLDSLSVNPEQGMTLAHQIKLQLAWLIASGRLPPGDRLPPVRDMAQRLSVNLHTVRSAYRLLADEGLVAMRPGSGTHVLDPGPQRLRPATGPLRTHTVGVILPNLTNPFYHAFLRGIEEKTAEDHALLFVCCSHESRGLAMRYFAQLAAKHVDGIILAAHDPAPYLADNSGPLPLVSVDWPGAACASVLLDLEGAGYQATQHLAEHGHRRIGLITFAHEAANVALINQGYRRALAEASLEVEPELIAAVPGFDAASGAAGARHLLSLRRPPSAVFAIADTLALGALGALKQAGRRVPQDVALAGFNDIDLAAQVEPPLTTVAAPAQRLGVEAMQLLHAQLAGQGRPKRAVKLPTHLVVRQSCGCP